MSVGTFSHVATHLFFAVRAYASCAVIDQPVDKHSLVGFVGHIQLSEGEILRKCIIKYTEVNGRLGVVRFYCDLPLMSKK